MNGLKSAKAPKQNTAAVIVAAGRGERAGTKDGPKQYRDLFGKSVLSRSLAPFLEHPAINQVVVVIHPDDKELYQKAIGKHAKLKNPVIGDKTRQLSALAGLEALKEDNIDKVLIHDAARPFVDPDLISRVVEGLDKSRATLPAIAVHDTLKHANANGLVDRTIARDGLFAAQTPQGFCYQTMLKAHQKAAQSEQTEFTDDSALAEWAEIPVRLVEGSADNWKITTRTDLEKARTLMNTPLPDIRVGHGYDTHQLVEGDKLWLCGVEIPHTHSLSGHSDADVGLHALTDALLATIGDGDIGHHFPPTDEQWKGAKSDQFLKHAVEQISDAGGTITHMDVTLLCETPKIGPNRQTMRAAISTISGIGINRISVKATTNEKMGFIGRQEGIVALATATVVMGTL